MACLYLRGREQWRNWLERNGKIAREIWLVHDKKRSGKLAVSYEDTVEEALCFGWIDGKIKKIDSEQYARIFTPRKADSRWSALNIARAQRLIRDGRMTASGLAAFEGKRKAEPLPAQFPPKLEKLFRQEVQAWQNFQLFPPYYRRMTTGWVASAKKEETQLERLQQLIAFSLEKKKIKFI